MAPNRLKHRGAFLIIAPFSVWATILLIFLSCQGEDFDFQNLSGQERGAVPGKFAARLSQPFRDQIDTIQAQIENLIPGSAASLSARFVGADPGDSANDLGDGGKLSDLLALDFPGTDSEMVNRLVFGKLVSLKQDGQTIFDRVDSEKYLSNFFADVPVNDPKADQQYYLDQIAWKEALQLSAFGKRIQQATPVVVAVADTGVNQSHEDLGGAMWSFDGFVGFDATAANGAGQAIQQANDIQGHGTHVAGIVAAIGNNSKGIHGIGSIEINADSASNRMVEIMDVRVLNENGGGTSQIMENAIKWAIDKHWQQKANVPERNKQRLIVNMSLGGPFETSGYEYPSDSQGKPKFQSDIFTYASRDGDVLIIAAAGNDSCSLGSGCKIGSRSYSRTFYYPCSYESVMCIAASDNQDKIADFSNRGESVVMASPGYLILSTVNKGNDVYEKWNGTSMATPVTAGAAAILWSLYPEFRGSEIETILRATQDKVLSLTQSFASGAGRLNLAAAITYAEELSPSNDDGTPQLASHNTPTLDGGIGKVSNQPRSGDAGADGPANTIGQREEDLPICIDEPCSATASAQEGCGTISSKKNPSGTSPISLWFLLLFPILMAIVSIAAPQKPTKNSFN